MSTKIFVGRLAEGTVDEDLLVLFRKFGTVTECSVMGNYAFVHMSSETEAKAAIADLDGYTVKGSHIHVELSTASTQGRKKRMERGDGGRFEPYPPQRFDSYGTAGYRGGAAGAGAPAPPADRADRQGREEYASEQVKDLLELYFRDPYAFDQYAKTYYYGERAERARAYYDRRMPEAEDPYGARSNYAASGVVDPAVAAAAATAYTSRPTVAPVRDERYRAASAAYLGGRM